MRTVSLVGCGFLGSTFAFEAAKRLYATDLHRDVLLRLVDYDVVDERNVANQLYGVVDIGESKVEALAGMIDAQLGSGVSVPTVGKLGEDNGDELLKDSVLIVDALDNIEARTLLWYWAMQNNVPILHMGVSQQGTGAVEWSTKDYDSWSLSPANLQGRKITAGDPKKLPPCELVTFRGLGLNTALAGAKAMTLWTGMDPEELMDLPRKGMKLDKTGILTDWMSTDNSHELQTRVTDELSWGGKVLRTDTESDNPLPDTQIEEVTL